MRTFAHTHRPRFFHTIISVKFLRALVCVAFVCAIGDVRTFAQRTKRGATSTTNKPAAANARPAASDDVPLETLLRIVRAEDERRYDADLSQLLSDRRALVRRRAALAAGRIGDERAIPALAKLLDDRIAEVRAAAAFALGETELSQAARSLIDRLHRDGEMSSDRPKTPVSSRLTNMTSRERGKIVEALGKIAAAIPTPPATAASSSTSSTSNQSSAAATTPQQLTGDARIREVIGELILSVLETERTRRPKPDAETILLALTAALRARPANANQSVAAYLQFTPDARVRADAANTLSRLRAKDQNQSLRQALNDTDAVVRANAARALGAAGDAESFAQLLSRATTDADERVRTSSIRSLAALKDTRAVQPLVQRAAMLLAAFRASQQNGGASQQSGNGSPQSSSASHPSEQNEMLELASALGALVSGAGGRNALLGAQAAQDFLRDFSDQTASTALEVEIAFARHAPAQYLRRVSAENFFAEPSDANLRWQKAAAVAQALATFAQADATQSGNTSLSSKADAQLLLRQMLTDTARPTPAVALPEVLRALLAYKPADSGDVLRAHLTHSDVIVRATAAELLAELPPADVTTRALAAALPAAMNERMNDAALATLNALSKQQNSTDAIKSALASNDHLVRRRAAQLLKTMNAGDYAARTGTVRTRLTEADYRRALERRTKRVRAELTTDKGIFVIGLLAKDAPLTVDNFIELARKGVFDNVTFHRVVSNFVVQTGDYVRGDGNGGPDYQIRCEINEVPYARGAVGMALSGKDTGGSQWFVTHSPQPHLDGGYTVFGRVVEGMTTIDRIARGDVIRSVKIIESRR